MPLLAPVMTATFPSSFVMIFSPLENISSHKGPLAGGWTIPSNRRAHAFSGTSLRRKCHENAMSIVIVLVCGVGWPVTLMEREACGSLVFFYYSYQSKFKNT